ncbi:MAG: RadC family protein [Burkholderiaceae bacterium]|jgi:DNA repair protein RadC
MAITDLPAEQRPRERLLAHGPGALSDSELLAIFLRVGTKGKSAIELGQDMLQRFGSLECLLRAPLPEWRSIRGLGPAKYVQFMASLELARRTIREPLQKNCIIDSQNAARDFVALKLRHEPIEKFLALFLDNRHRLIRDEIMFAGTVAQTAVYPREIVKRALQLNSSAVLIAHNHPSGLAEPSQADLSLTEAVGRALQLLDIRLLDHLIVAGPQTVSLRGRSDWPLP